jgi:hypothetical protein
MPPQLITLVAIHLVLALLPFCYGWVPPHVRYMPIIWLIGSITVAQTMLLGFWLGMGTNPWRWRVIGTILGCAYLGLPMFGGAPLQSLMYAVIVLLLGSMFLVMRRWWVLQKLTTNTIFPAVPSGFQFSIFHLLVLTSVAALVLALARSARLAGPPDSAWFGVFMWGLMLSTFAINAVSSVLATLAVHACRPKLIATFMVSLFLGMALCLVMSRPVTGAPALPWWISLGGLYITTCLTLIIVLTLLVVRSSGYRLIPRSLTSDL